MSQSASQETRPAMKRFGIGKLMGIAAMALLLVAASCGTAGDTAQFGSAPNSKRAGLLHDSDGRADSPASADMPRDMVVLEAENPEELKKLEEALGPRAAAEAPTAETGPNSAFGYGGGGGGMNPQEVKRGPASEAAKESQNRAWDKAGRAVKEKGNGDRSDSTGEVLDETGRGVPAPGVNPDQDTITPKQRTAIASVNRIHQARQGELWCKPVIRPDAAVEAIAFPLKHTAVNASISGFVASTTVTQNYENPFETPIEAVYVFPLPSDSAVNGFTMTIGERIIKGLIRKRAEAKEIYEIARRSGFTASLLEQERPNVFTQSIANIAPKQAIKVDITYVNQLKRVRGTYEYSFPMVVAPRYNAHAPDAGRISPPMLPEGMRNGHDISLNVKVDAGMPVGNVNSVNHKVAEKRLSGSELEITLDRADNIPNRDFVLRFDVLGAELQTGFVTHAVDGRGYLSMMFTPPASPNAVDLSPREVTFLLDVSGSMTGTPHSMCLKIMNMALDRLRPHDSFNIVYFASGNGQLWELPKPNTPENVAAAKAYLGRLRAGGGTEMLAGLRRLFETPKANNALRMVVFLTDGLVGNETQILEEVKKNAEGSRFFIYGIGDSTNSYLIDGIGKHGRGYATTVYTRDAARMEVSVDEFFSRIDAPCLTDISIDWGGLPVSESYPALIPDVFAGHPVSLVAKYTPAKGGMTGTVKIRGRKAGAPVEYSIQVELPEADGSNAGIASVWARQKIESLMDARLGADRRELDGISAQIVDVALTHSLVSEGTSFVAVDESQKVGDGSPKRVDVPVELPSGMDRRGLEGGASGGGK